MNLLIVINSLSTGGAEKLLVDTIPRYYKEGFKITLCVLNGLETPFLSSLEAMNVCSVVKLSNATVYHPYHILRLRNLMKEYSVVHAHLFPTLYWVAFANLFRNKKSKLIFTEHNTTNRRTGLIFKWIDRFVYSKYSKIIAIAEPVASFLHGKLKLKKGQLELINNGIEVATFQNALPLEKSHFGLSDDTQLVIQVSSFTPQKDQDTLLRAITLLPNEVHLFLVGDGPKRLHCEALANSLKITDRVHFLGIRSDVPRLLKMAQVVVLSSYYEGLSLSSIEALASGVPFIASNVPGLGSIVKDAGILFEQGNYQALAHQITTVLSDSEYASKVGQKGYERAQHYSISTMVAKHVKLYRHYGKA